MDVGDGAGTEDAAHVPLRRIKSLAKDSAAVSTEDGKRGGTKFGGGSMPAGIEVEDLSGDGDKEGMGGGVNALVDEEVHAAKRKRTLLSSDDEEEVAAVRLGRW